MTWTAGVAGTELASNDIVIRMAALRSATGQSQGKLLHDALNRLVALA